MIYITYDHEKEAWTHANDGTMHHHPFLVGGVSVKRKMRYTLSMLLGLLLVLIGLLFPIVEIGGERHSIPMVNMGLIIIILMAISYWLHCKEDVEFDERTRKIGGYGLSYSWYLTLLLACILFWIDYLHLLVLSVQNVLGATILVMTFSAMIFKWHLSRKGDVE